MTALHAVGGGLSLPLAIHLPRIVEQIGSMAGFAAVAGLAVLSALYFSQARDLRRLREWAGRAPERAAEQAAAGQVASPVPGRVVAMPQQQRPGAQAPGAGPATPAAAGAAAPAQAGNGAPPAEGETAEDAQKAEGDVAAAANGDSKPTVATGGKPDGGGEQPEGEPSPAGAPAAKPGMPGPASAAAAAGTAAAGTGAGAASASGPAAPSGTETGGAAAAQAGGQDSGEAPAPGGTGGSGPGAGGTAPATSGSAGTATPPKPGAPGSAPAAPSGPGGPAAGAGAPPASGPGRPAPPPTRPPTSVLPPRTGVAPPVRRAGGTASANRAITPAPPERPKRSPAFLALAVIGVLVVGAGAAIGVPKLVSGGDDATPKKAKKAPRKKAAKGPAIRPDAVTVSVLNGTDIQGLAAQIGDQAQNQGFNLGNTAQVGGVLEGTTQQRSTSIVMYVAGHARDARFVARKMHITGGVEPIDANSRALADDATVVIVVGRDQTR
jgi:hypothetical protein